MISSYTPAADAEIAATAAKAGADVVRAMYGTRLDRVDKGGGDFATAADIEAEKTILGVIRAARPDDAFLGEEGGRQGGAPGTRREWLVDPLCGTLNYAAGTMLVAVNVALRGGAAAVADPFADEILCTDGATAWLRKGGIAAGALTPSAANRLVDVNLDPLARGPYGFRALDMLAHPAFDEHFRTRVGSTSLGLAWVAAGRRAAYVTDGGDVSSSVHFAAGIALCHAAGAVVTALDGTPLSATTRGLVAAADAPTHARLLSIISASH